VNPQSWNRYSYVLNDPIHNVDPLGLFESTSPEVSPDPCGIPPDPEPIEPQRPTVNYTDLSYRVYNFFAAKVNCESYFLGKGIWDSFLQRAAEAKYIDFSPADPNNYGVSLGYRFRDIGLTSNLGTAGLNIHDTLFLGAAVIGVGVIGGYGITWGHENTITIGLSFYTLPAAEQDRTIVHEVLHLFFGGNHKRIVEELFGLVGVGDGQASIALNRFLDSDCTDYH
jgi:hypothetical protein